MKKPKSRFKRVLESKTTTIISLVILMIPFIVFGYIIFRDSSQTGDPVIGSRFDDQLEPAIKDSQLETIESGLSKEIVSKKVTLKAATLRIYLEVDQSVNKEAIKELADNTYSQVVEVLPIETYFSLQGSKKMYDFEVHVFNNVEDRDSEDFIYYQIIKSSSSEESVDRFVTDVKDAEFKEEVLGNLAEKQKAAAAEEEAKKDANTSEEEDDQGGE